MKKIIIFISIIMSFGSSFASKKLEVTNYEVALHKKILTMLSQDIANDCIEELQKDMSKLKVNFKVDNIRQYSLEKNTRANNITYSTSIDDQILPTAVSIILIETKTIDGNGLGIFNFDKCVYLGSKLR